MTYRTTNDTAIVEFVVFNLQNKLLKSTLVVDISKAQKSILPSGNSVLKSCDKVIILTQKYNKKYLKKLFS